MVLEKLLDKLSIKESRLLCICILILTPLMLCGQTQEEAQALHDKGRELMEAGKVAEGDHCYHFLSGESRCRGAVGIAGTYVTHHL